MSASSDQTQSIPVFPGYIVVDTIGVGGMGAVYKAEKENVTYALKTILSENIDKQALARFQREALAAAAVDKHPNIVSVHKLELNSQPPFLVMDYVEGQALDQFIHKGEIWPLDQVLELLNPLADALDHMHRRGIIHRDLKPANILIRRHDGAPMITDFGIARESSRDTLTKTGEILGTPEYMAPEQLDDAKNACPQTDLWSLAVISYELLTGGQTPFHATSLFQLAEDLLCKPPDLSALDDEDGRVLQVLERAFNKKPELRFSNCREFLTAFEDEPPAPRNSYYRIPLVLFILLLIALSFYWAKKAPIQQRKGSYKQEYISLSKEIQRFQTKEMAQHFYLHIIGEVEDNNDDCVVSKKLYLRAIRLVNEMTQIGLSPKKIEKRTKRWHDFLSFVRIVEKLDPAAQIETPNSDVQRQLQAFQLLPKGSPNASRLLKYKPDNPDWRKSWLWLRIQIAKQQKLHAQSLEYLQTLKREYPEETRFDSDLWFARAKVAEARGNNNPVERFKALFAYWKYQQRHPRFKIPPLYHFGLNNKGQLDVLKLNKALDKIRFKTPKVVLNITIEAANHGIYIDSLDSFRHRRIIDELGLAKSLAQQEPKNSAALFWKAYAPLLSSSKIPFDKLQEYLLTIRRNIDKAIQSSLPSFYHAILLAHRANLLDQLAMAYPNDFNKADLFTAALSDLDEALKYPHPKPHLIHLFRFRILLRRCQSKEELLQEEPKLLQCLEQYFAISKKYYDEPVTIRNKNLSKGRPPGIPFARFSDNNYEDFQTNYYGGLLSVFVATENWKAAKEASDKLLYLTKEPVAYERRILILTRLKEWEQLAFLKNRILRLCKPSVTTTKRNIPAFRNLALQIDKILANPRRR